MFKNLIRKAFGDPGEREAKRLKPVVDQINALAAEFEHMSDDELRGQTDAFRATIAERVGTLRDDLALAREEWLQEPDVNAQNQLRLEVQRLEKELRQAEAEAMEEILPRALSRPCARPQPARPACATSTCSSSAGWCCIRARSPR